MANPADSSPSMGELRTFFADAAPVASVVTEPEPILVTQEAQTETPESVVEPQQSERARGADGKFKAADEKTQEPEASTAEEKEEPLPPAVAKRIAKEVADQARYDREIQAAVSARKAKQAELERLKADTGTSGSEPAQTTAPAKTEGKPVKPIWEGEEKDPGAVKYWAAQGEYLEKHDAWLVAETRRAAREEVEAERHSEKVNAKIEAGKKKHGSDFQGMLDTVLTTAPEKLQIEIGRYEDWPDTVAHFGKNPDELKALGALFESNPSMAIRELGRLEDRLKKPATKEPDPAVPVKALPEPTLRVGGSATASKGIDLNKAEQDVFNREARRIMGIR